MKNNILRVEVLRPPTSVQSLRSSTVVSVGLMLMLFSSIKLFKELPPGLEKCTICVQYTSQYESSRRAMI